jgi:enoyl-[acyl-carrier-protein] reductase (NADH)
MKTKIIAITLTASIFTSCKPVRVDPIKEIEPNETAFVVPLEIDTSSQEKFESIEFLTQQQVAAKRIIIPQRERKVGRMPWSIEWIPIVRVLTVDRTPVTRNWIYDPKEYDNIGLSQKTFGVESKDSIGFSVGVNVSAYIDERDTATYLYYYRGGDLANVMDQNVREKVHTVLSQEFASRTLQECKVQKAEIRDALVKQVAEHFLKYGITITSIGLAEGLFFEQEEIQQAINDAYVAEMEVEREKQKTKAQEEINKRLLSLAQGEKAQALEFAAAAEERKKLVDIEIDKMRAEAFLEIAKKWDGKVPHYLGGGENFLLNLK